MKNIEIKKVASANEAIAIINRLNYTACTFEYRHSTFSDDYATEYRHFDTDNAFAIVEIVQGGKLVAVRFYNLYRDITVELQFGDITLGEEFYGKFNVINVDDEIEIEQATEADIEDYAVSTEAQDAAIDAEIELAKTANNTAVTFKLANDGTSIYYVDGKRTSREIALDAAAENRKGNLFTVETGYWNEGAKTVNYKTLMIIAECPIKIQQQAFCHDIGFRVIVSSVEVKTFYANKNNTDDIKKARRNAAVLANKIAYAYIIGAYGIRILGGYDIKILDAPIAEADINDYAVTTGAQEVAIAAEIEQAAMTANETDGSEDDNDDDEVFSLLPNIDDLNDVDDNITVIKSSDGMPTVFEFTRDGNEIKTVFVANGSVSYYNGEVSYISDEICRAGYSTRRQEFFIAPTVERVYPKKAYNNTEEFFAEMIERGICSICESTVTPSHEDEAELTAEQIQKLIDANIAERIEAIDALEEAEADEEISQTHIDYLKEYIDKLLDEYNDLCRQLDAAKAKASVDETDGSESGNLPAPETPPTVQAITEQLIDINSTAPEDLEIYYDAETKKFPVISYGGKFPEIYYELDSLALYNILTPEEFWTRIKRGCSTDEEMIEWLENSIAQARGQREYFAADENPDLELLSWLDFEIADREGELAAIKAKMNDNG